MTPAETWSLHQIIDRQHRGMVAAAVEHPPGWHAASELVWNFEHMSFPLTTRARLSDPSGAAVFEFHPAESFCWVEPDYGMLAPGTNALGQTVMRPMPLGEALARWVIPKHRGNRPGLQLTGVGPMPELLHRVPLNTQGATAEGVTGRIEYSEQGKAVEEAFFGIGLTQVVPSNGPWGPMRQINWGFARLFSFRSLKGAMEAAAPGFWRIAESVRVNPAWEALYAQVVQQLQEVFNGYIAMGYSQIQAAGQLSQAISAQNDAMLASLEQQRQASARSSRPAERSSADGFSEYIRGVETMNDPYHGTSEQDYNYRYHWTDGFGNYRHSNDPFFNPNIGGTQSWTLMEPPK